MYKANALSPPAPPTASPATAAMAAMAATVIAKSANQNPMLFEAHAQDLRGGEETLPSREGGPPLPTLPSSPSPIVAENDSRSSDDLRLDFRRLMSHPLFRLLLLLLLVDLRWLAWQALHETTRTSTAPNAQLRHRVSPARLSKAPRLSSAPPPFWKTGSQNAYWARGGCASHFMNTRFPLHCFFLGAHPRSQRTLFVVMATPPPGRISRAFCVFFEKVWRYRTTAVQSWSIYLVDVATSQDPFGGSFAARPARLVTFVSNTLHHSLN